MNIHIRNYAPEDCLILARLFYDTVHTVNARDYTPEQLEAWAPAPPDPELWNPSFLKHIFLKHITFVAEADGKIAGFGDIDSSGWRDTACCLKTL